MRVPDVRPNRSRPEPLSARAHHAFQAWLARHIVADDPYDGENIQQVLKDERTPVWMGVGLSVMLVSAILSITASAMPWEWLAG